MGGGPGLSLVELCHSLDNGEENAVFIHQRTVIGKEDGAVYRGCYLAQRAAVVRVQNLGHGISFSDVIALFTERVEDACLGSYDGAERPVCDDI